jgi:hypothetical protein
MDGLAPPRPTAEVKRNPQISQLGPHKWLVRAKIRNSQAQACGTRLCWKKARVAPTFIIIFIGEQKLTQPPHHVS